MTHLDTYRALDEAGVALPKVITLRHIDWAEGDETTFADAERLQLVIKRVKKGDALETADTAEHYAHYIARIDHWGDLATLFDNAHLTGFAEWGEEALQRLAEEVTVCCEKGRGLVDLFMEKGKLLLHSSDAPYVSPKYVTKNFTLEAHAIDWLAPLQTGAIRPNLFAHMIAQHLDHPEDTGKRRHSTSPLFDSCFNGEKALGDDTLAAHIDAHLKQHWLVHSEDGKAAIAETRALFDGGRPATNSSQDRVRQRERFAAMIEYYIGGSQRTANAKILQEYMTLVMLDLQHLEKRNAPYPPQERDALSQQLHQPLAVLFNTNQQASHGSFTARIRAT